MPRRSSISGKVVPEFTGISVGLGRYSYDDDGESRLVNVASVRTSREIGKFGEYRFENVGPGEYYVYFNPASFLSPTAPKGEMFPTIYYPGALDLATASKVVVKDGASIQLGDLNFVSEPAPAIRVHLVNATGDEDAPKRCVSVIFKQRGTPDDGMDPPSSTRCAAGELSSFNAGTFAPGIYDVYAGWQAGPNGGLIEGAAVSLEVRNLDLDIEVAVSRARVTGTIALEEADGKLRPARGVHVNFKPKRIGVGPDEWAETDANGLFRRDRVGRNEYWVEFQNLPPSAYVARMIQDTRDVLEDGLDVRSTDIQLDGQISLSGGAIEGTVSNENHQGSARATVVLIPDGRLQQKHLYRVVRSGDDGRFTFQGIAPGSYQLFAWSNLNGAAYKNPQFMSQYEGRGQAVAVEKNGRLTISAKLLD